MAGAFPILEDGQVCRYPVRRSSSWSTHVDKFVDMSEKRWVEHLPLAQFIFEYKDLSRADIDTLRKFFDTQKGMFDPTFTVEFDGLVYENMGFDQDDFRFTEDKFPQRYSISLKLRQFRPSGIVPTFDPLATKIYPKLNAQKIITQKPWTNGVMYMSIIADNPTGPRYSDYWLATPLARWELAYAAIEIDELRVLEDFFNQMHGREQMFEFWDPDVDEENPHNLPVSTCRFDQDSMEVTYISPGVYSTKLSIIEIWVNGLPPVVNPNPPPINPPPHA